MIDEVEVGKKYRLIDKEAYTSGHMHSEYNRRLLNNKHIFDENMCVVISHVDSDYGISHDYNIIAPSEYCLFELVEENEMKTEESEVITPGTTTEVTFTISYGELARAYYAVGKVNGTTHGKSLWSIIGNLLGDTDYSIYLENNPDHSTINYIQVQKDWESLFFKSKEQQQKELAIKDKRALIAKLENEIEELKSGL